MSKGLRNHTSRFLWKLSPIIALFAFLPVVIALAFECEDVVPVSGDAISLKLVTSNLQRPVDATAPAGDLERLFVVEQAGRIRIVNLANDSLAPVPYLDIRSKVQCCGEKGLLGLAFHPRYEENGLFFVNYTRRPDGDTVVARYQVSEGDANLANSGSETVLLTIPQPYDNHNGGKLAFGPLDGYLYISTGDGGSGGDPQNNAQNPNSLLGKLLRIDVDASDETRDYGIPLTNPFVNTGDVLDEIWALGLRNPWRFAFDPETGDMYIGDVGQRSWEEIDFQPANSTGGENYEWRMREGNHDFNTSRGFGPGTRVGAILEYPHSGGDMSGCSVTGGVVYRGCRMPDLHQTYFFADYCNDWVRSFRFESGEVVDLRDRTAELNAGISPDRLSSIVAFGTGGRGEVYISSVGGQLYRIVAANPPSEGPRFLRADANDDGQLDVADSIFTLEFVFLGNPAEVPCLDALDSNDDGAADISDPVFTLEFVFIDGEPPPPPFSECGEDNTAEDGLNCETSTCE